MHVHHLQDGDGMNLSMLDPGSFVFEPLPVVTRDVCESAIKGAQAMNKFYIIACIALFALWCVTAYKAGWFKKEIKLIKGLMKR